MRSCKGTIDDRTSVEVETAGTPRVIVMFFDEGQPFWRLEVVGLARKGSKAVGTLAENFQSVSEPR